jgi:GAF domain-containing protein
MSALLPTNEVERLAALRALNLLDTLPEQSFDDFAQLASEICGTPISLVSLVDEHRQWFKARVGLEAVETSRDLSFCAHAILQPAQLFVVPDAQRDPRFLANQLVVGPPHISFYAGMPLVTPEGHSLGTLCVIDRRPRELATAQMESLRRLARQLGAQLELRQQALRLAEAEELMARRAAELSRTNLLLNSEIEERKRVETERERLITELQHALAEVKTLSGLLPICGWCKKTRDDTGYWDSLEGYLRSHHEVGFTHGICPACSVKMMDELNTAVPLPPRP